MKNLKYTIAGLVMAFGSIQAFGQTGEIVTLNTTQTTFQITTVGIKPAPKTIVVQNPNGSVTFDNLILEYGNGSKQFRVGVSSKHYHLPNDLDKFLSDYNQTSLGVCKALGFKGFTPVLMSLPNETSLIDYDYREDSLDQLTEFLLRFDNKGNFLGQASSDNGNPQLFVRSVVCK